MLSLPRGVASVCDDRRPVEEGGSIGDQEEDGVGDLLRRPQAPHDLTLGHLLPHQDGIRGALDDAIHPGRLRGPGGEAVGADASIGVVDGEAPRQGDERRLRRAVRRARGDGDEPSHGGHVDEDAAAPREHLWQGLLADDEGGAHVDRERLIPLRDARLRHVGPVADPGVVDHDLDAAEQLRGHVGSAPGLARVREVGDDRLAHLVPDLVDEAPERVGIPVDRRDATAGAREPHDGAAADPRSPAGHEGTHPVDPPHVHGHALLMPDAAACARAAGRAPRLVLRYTQRAAPQPSKTAPLYSRAPSTARPSSPKWL